MALTITLASLKWDGIVGATGYEIVVDGKAVSTTGPRARTTRVSVDDATKVEVVDLPARSHVQELNFTQGDSA